MFGMLPLQASVLKLPHFVTPTSLIFCTPPRPPPPQASVLKLWSEDRENNGQKCRDMAAALARANGQAALGRYEGPHPSITSQQGGGSLVENFRGWRTDV